MARKRDLRPSFFANEYLASLPFEARLLFAGLWTIADRRGRLEDRPLRIKGALFPYDNLDVDNLLQSLADNEDKFIIRYIVDGKRYIQVTNFEKNQHIHKDEVESIIPEPPKIDDNSTSAPLNNNASTTIAPLSSGVYTDAVLCEHHSNTPSSLIASSSVASSVVASSVVINNNNSHTRNEMLELFDVFWSNYPRKVAKKDAIKAWQKLKPDKELAQRLIQAVKIQAKSAQWIRDDGQFIPYAATWLNGQRWHDSVAPPEKPPDQKLDPSVNPFKKRGE